MESLIMNIIMYQAVIFDDYLYSCVILIFVLKKIFIHIKNVL